jgi:uncharacterized membrane protein
MARSAAPQPTPALTSNRFRTAALVLLGLATALSAWLVHLSLASGPVAGCDAGNCGVVLGSKWAKVFGVPVGLFGGASYLVLLLLGFRPIPGSQRPARITATALALLIPAAALWFVGLQMFVIKAFCPWCCTTHAIASLGAILMMLAWRQDTHPAPSNSPRKSQRPSPAAAPAWGAAAGLAGLAFAGFALAQALSPEPPKAKMLTASMSDGPATPPGTSTNTPARADGQATNPATAAPAIPNTPVPTPATSGAPAQTQAPAPAPKRLVLHGGKFTLDPHAYPCNGSPDAEHVILMISDYTCPHCRAAYKIIKEVRNVFDGRRVGITMLPSHHGGDSLELQLMMLAAWKLEPEIWADVASDLYLERIPLRPDVVRQTLSQRLGPGRLEAAREATRAWAQSTFDLAREIHAANKAKTGSGSIPQFIIGDKIVVGSPVDAADVYNLFKDNLNLVRDRFPILALPRTEMNLGRLFAGTGPTLGIPVSNAGLATLQLSRATVPNSGRTLRGLQTPIESGRTGLVEIAVNVPRDPGPFEQTVTLFSNAQNPEEKVHLKGVSWKPIRVTPALLDLGRVDPDNPQPTEGIMRLELDEEARIQSVTSQNPGFEAVLREVTPSRLYELVVRPGKSLPTGVQQTALMVALQKPVPAGWPETLAFAARVQIERAITVIPQRLMVPEGVLAAERHHQVLVRCNDGTTNFVVQSAVLDGGPAFAMPDIQPGGRANEFIVRLTLPAGWSLPQPPAEAKLTLQTTHPKTPVIEVPLSPQTR